MPSDSPIGATEINPSHLLLIVVGAHLRAEVADRPLARHLGDRINDWLDEHHDAIEAPFIPVTCCDVWYVNHEPLHQRPTISVGGPGVNALAAYYNSRLPHAFVRDDQLLIQLDPEFVDLRVCLWGMDHQLTCDALELFEQRYLDGYLRAVVTQVEPQHD